MAKEYTKHLYLLCDPDTGAVRYVGASVSPKRRALCHKGMSKLVDTRVAVWVRSLYDQGKAPVMDVLDAKGPDEWEDEERFLISYLRFLGFDLLNMSSGGLVGSKACQEHREKLGAASRGRKQTEEQIKKRVESRRGYVDTPEVRQKRLKAARARVWTPENRAAAAEYGRLAQVTEESRAKMREARRLHRERCTALGVPLFTEERREKIRAAALRREANRRAEREQLATNP